MIPDTHSTCRASGQVVICLLLAALGTGSVAGPAASAGPTAAPQVSPLSRLAHTYSIVARDSTTGELGVAVQSHWFSVGTLVPWAESGVGAVATQSLVNASFGPVGLVLLQAGNSPQEALRGLLATDDGAAYRQVALIDATGRVAVHTGENCIPEAGHLVGDGYAVCANLMLSAKVWPAMAAAFEAAEGDLAERMLQALEAAEATGGDIRGRQSAALLVVAAESTGRSWADRKVDLRVADAAEPLRELRRLLDVQRAYDHMNRGDEALGAGEVELARKEYGTAARLYPENSEIRFWQAVAMSQAGLIEEALPIFGDLFAVEPNWRILVPRLHQVGLMTVTDEQMERILGAVPDH